MSNQHTRFGTKKELYGWNDALLFDTCEENKDSIVAYVKACVSEFEEKHKKGPYHWKVGSSRSFTKIKPRASGLYYQPGDADFVFDSKHVSAGGIRGTYGVCKRYEQRAYEFCSIVAYAKTDNWTGDMLGEAEKRVRGILRPTFDSMEKWTEQPGDSDKQLAAGNDPKKTINPDGKLGQAPFPVVYVAFTFPAGTAARATDSLHIMETEFKEIHKQVDSMEKTLSKIIEKLVLFRLIQSNIIADLPDDNLANKISALVLAIGATEKDLENMDPDDVSVNKTKH